MSATRALIGRTGFVGKNLLQQIQFTSQYHSLDIEEIRGKTFDEVYCAGLPAAKWLANKNPEEDWSNVEKLMQILDSIEVKRAFVLISTIDVYPSDILQSGKANEESKFSASELHAYGKHRLLFEEYVTARFPGIAIVIRLPALFGFGLKKNAIYDLLHNNQVDKINPKSIFQFYNLSNLANDIEQCKVLSVNHSIFNLFSEPLLMRDIVDLLFPQYKITANDVIHKKDEPCGAEIQLTPVQIYNVKSCTKSNYPYWSSREEILAGMAAYICNLSIKDCSKIVVSNIAWNQEEEVQALSLLQGHGITKIEVAPTKLCEWDELDKFDASAYLAKLSTYGIKVDSLQAVTFGKPELELFKNRESRERLFAHLCDVIKFANKLNCNFIVFGSPKNRRIGSYLNREAAWDIAVEFFSRLADCAAENNVCFCIEPNAEQYGCDFCTGAIESARLVRQVNKPNFKLHFDTGCSTMAGEQAETIIPAVADVLVHVHISQSFLSDFNQARIPEHKVWQQKISSIGYTGDLCIEMAGTNKTPLNLSNLNNALLFVKNAYLTAQH